MRFTPRCSAIWILALVAGCSPKADSPHKDDPSTNPLFGMWQAISCEAQGQQIMGQDALGMRITFTPEKAIWHFDTPQGAQSYDGYCRINAATKPCEIDLRQPKSADPNRTAYGIYQIDGDMLRISMGVERPKNFDEPTLIKLVFKRAGTRG